MQEHHIDPVLLWPIEFVSSRVADRLGRLLMELEAQSRPPASPRLRDLHWDPEESTDRDF